MDDIAKNVKKNFTAPCKKINSLKSHNDKSKEKLKDPDLSKCGDKKKRSNQDTAVNPKKERNSKKKAYSVGKSLTDDEYSDIFKSVLKKALHDDKDVKDDDLPTLQHDNSNATCSDTKHSGGELDEMSSDLQVDQWSENERSEETQQEKKMWDVTKKDKKKLNTVTDKARKERKSKCQFNTDTQNGLNQNTVKENNGQIDSIEENDDEEESGTWIQCSVSDCGKWRYVADIPDPVGVPEHWECRMNSDKNHNKCDAPEEKYDESDHILTKYTLGSVVWAKMDGFPWWPAMIDSDPDYDTYFELPTATSMIPYLYHVTFFDDHVSRAWLKSNLITSYNYKFIPNNKSNKRELQTAIQNAETALKLSLKDRLNQYCFLKRYSKLRTTAGEVRKRRKRNNDSQRQCLVGKKENTTKKILSSSRKMLKELDLAIKDCNASEDEDCSEGEKSESEVNEECSKRDSCTHKNWISSNVEHADSVDSDNEHGVAIQRQVDGDDSCSELEKENKSNKIQFDPAIFTMELDSQECSTHNDKNHCNEYVNVPLSCSEICQNFDTKESQNRTVKSISKKKKDEKKLKCNREKNKDAKNRSKRTPSNNAKSNDIENKEVTLTSKREVDQQSGTEFDSEKENKDPEQSKNEENVVSKKRKIEKQSENMSTKQQKNTNVNEEFERKNETKNDTIKFDELIIHKKVEKSKSILSGSSKKNYNRPGSASEKMVTSNAADHCTDKKFKDCHTRKETKRNIKKQQPPILEDEEMPEAEYQGEKPITVKQLFIREEKAGDTNLITPTANSDENVLGTDEKEHSIMKKCVKKSKGFVNPSKQKAVSKSCDRNVPTTPSEKSKKSDKNISQEDQFVPDMMDNFIEDDKEFLGNEVECIKGDHKDENVQALMEENSVDQEELDLSIDSLDAESQCNESLLDLDFKVKNKKLSNSDKSDDKDTYGRFGGHCNDHGSDSDPFELIEE